MGQRNARLSQQVAAEVSDLFADGTWWVELVAASEGIGVPLAIAASIGGSTPSGAAPGSALAATIAGRRMLLVLDNCEQVIAPVAQLVACSNLAATVIEPFERHSGRDKSEAHHHGEHNK